MPSPFPPSFLQAARMKSAYSAINSPFSVLFKIWFFWPKAPSIKKQLPKKGKRKETPSKDTGSCFERQAELGTRKLWQWIANFRVHQNH